MESDTEGIHGAPPERQAALALAEAKLLVNAFEASVPVRAEDAAFKLRQDGVAAVESVLDDQTAAALLAHVNERLELARSVGQESAKSGEEPLLGAIMCRERRWDVKLDSDEPAVSAALTQLIESLGRPVSKLLGRGAVLFELGALVVDAGAARQPVHPDTPFSSSVSVVTCMVALQHVGLSMGPTHFLPRTHTQRSRAAVWGISPSDDEGVSALLEESVTAIPLPRRGDGVCFDARTLHCGSAHTQVRHSRVTAPHRRLAAA